MIKYTESMIRGNGLCFFIYYNNNQEIFFLILFIIIFVAVWFVHWLAHEKVFFLFFILFFF